MGIFDVAWIFATLRVSTPLVFASMGELVAQRAGVINIGLEGMMLGGAFTAFVAFWLTGNVTLGVLSGALAGILLAAVMAILTIDAKADQIVVGVGVLILAIGLTTFLDQTLFEVRERVALPRMAPWPIPVLSDVPLIGPVFFRHIPLVYLAYLSVILVWLVLHKTNTGISVRAVGENPEAADTAGVSVRGVRWLCTCFAGGMAGIGGAFLSVAQLGLFVENMSAGRGFLALAAVFFGKWHPALVLLGCLVFGGANALQLRLQVEPFVPPEVWLVLAIVAIGLLVLPLLRGRGLGSWVKAAVLGATAVAGLVLFSQAPHWDLPAQLWLALPYIMALIVLGGFVGRARMPSALAIPYRRGGDH